MKIMKEGNLKIRIEGEIDAWKFDGESHGLTHCMKAVDIIIDFPKHYLFLEFKDPQHPNALPKDRERYIRKLKAGKLDEDLKYKYRDSFLYQWAMGRLDKPIHYFVLVADDSLSGAELMNRSDSLSRILPLRGPGSGTWNKRIVESCAVLNIASWNRHLPQFPVSRLAP